MKRILICLVLLGCYTVQVTAQAVFDSMDVSIKKFMEEMHVPGFAAAIVHDGKITWSKGYGQADIANNTWAFPSDIRSIRINRSPFSIS